MLRRIKQISNRETSVFFLLLVLLLTERLLLLFQFSFDYVGSDDLVFWMAAKDYSEGIFHEPYFYGQNYNLMLEALFAAPLIKLGVPFNYALPIITSFISLFPFMLFSMVLFRNGFKTAAYFFLAIPIMLPIEYGISGAMSRGFVSGLFFSGFFVFPLLAPSKIHSWIICSIALGLGYIFNPNTVLMAFPVCLYLLLINYKNAWFYLISSIVLFPILLLEYLAKQFYIINPSYNMHPMVKLEFSFIQLIQNFEHLDNFFTYFMPVFWVAGWLILPGILIMGGLVMKEDRRKSFILILTTLLIFLTLGVNKVNDSINHLLLSSTRMYLAIPLITGLAVFWCLPYLKINTQKIKFSLILVVLVMFSVKVSILNTVVSYYTSKTNFGCVAIKKINDLKCKCDNIKLAADTNKVEVIVFSPTWLDNTAEMIFLDYGCPLLTDGLPVTLLTQHERRTWIFIPEKYKHPENVLFYGVPPDRVRPLDPERYNILSANPDMILLKNNKLRLDSLFQDLGYDYSR